MNEDEKSPVPEGVAIIGMSGRFPGAATIEALWDLLQAGREGIQELEEKTLEADVYGFASFREDTRYIRRRGILTDVEYFDASFFGMSPREASHMDPQQRLWLECAWEAMERAGYSSGRGERNVGVFVGATYSTYLVNNILSSRERAEEFLLGRSPEDYGIMLGNEKDAVATRTAFCLDLRGPAEMVQTFCSSSLVSIIRACQSLQQFESEMCLAGGVTIAVPHYQGYAFRDGAILSSDGYCRPFDHRARGTVPASGVAVVLLKRIEDALRDGDHIHAIIRGSATNNDGSEKMGFTAPSADGQAEAIALAQAFADVHPDTIGYVEAHGTGTALGDPIEVSGLTRAFRRRTQRKGFCGLGSLKSNLGHLDCAAGAAGLIKAVLALEHELIPASLHFERPNPEIDFQDSPFFVVSRPTPWPRGTQPRRAGVSSFGMGGTNAHAVLEEAPVRGQSGPSRPVQLLTLSARTPSALEATSANLARHLRQHPEINLADTAFTLAVGRAEFGHRRVVVAGNSAEAATALEENKRTLVIVAEKMGGRPSVVFMFPGQGAQHINMARAVYDHEPIFREHFDAGAQILRGMLGLDIRDLVFPDPRSAESAAEQLKQTAITQPVLFVVQFALAQLWKSWGVEPAAMIGHSVGEYTAAALSGVLAFKDALHLLSVRGRLMQARPTGGMLAVRLAAAEIEPRLKEPLALAAANAPKLSVISGPHDALAAFREELGADGVHTITLHTSHAYHSSMMDEAVGPFAEAVASIERAAPSIPWVSSLTGSWATAEEVADASFWARQLRGTVRFTQGIKLLMEQPNRIFLEVGPGTTLSTFVQQHPEGEHRRAVISSLQHAQDEGSALNALLTALGRFWAVGGSPDWDGFFGVQRRRRIILPTYPFERKRCWIDPPRRRQSPVTPSIDAGDHPQHVELSGEQESAGVEAPLNSVERRERLLAKILSILGEFWGEALALDVADRTHIEIGFDSLVLTQVSAKLEVEFSIPVPFRRFFEDLTTPRLIAEYLDENLTAEMVGPDDGLSGNSVQQPSGATAKRSITATPEDELGPPPTPDARLGRDPQGRPGWYRPDPDRPGKFIRIGG